MRCIHGSKFWVLAFSCMIKARYVCKSCFILGCTVHASVLAATPYAPFLSVSDTACNAV